MSNLRTENFTSYQYFENEEIRIQSHRKMDAMIKQKVNIILGTTISMLPQTMHQN